MAKAQNRQSRQAIFGASMTEECRRLILEVLAILFSFLPARTLRDFTTTQMRSSTSKLKRQCIEFSSARHFPFHILSLGSSPFRVKSGTSHNRSCAAMPLGIFGQ